MTTTAPTFQTTDVVTFKGERLQVVEVVPFVGTHGRPKVAYRLRNASGFDRIQLPEDALSRAM